MSYSIKRNIILDVKYSFLRFLQSYFTVQKRYTWDADVRTTKILIMDKNAIDLGIELKRPAIVLNRNNAGWSYITGNQDATNTNTKFVKLDGNAPNVGRDRVKVYSDLLTGTLTFTALSKNGVEAENLAGTLFSIFTGYKDELRKDGIHKVTNLSISPEQILKQNSEHELIAVNVNLTYYKQSSVVKDQTYNNLTIYIDGEELNETFDYVVNADGTSITFNRTVPDLAVVTADYIDAITLAEKVGEVLLATADPLVYTTITPGAFQGFYVLLNDIILDISTV